MTDDAIARLFHEAYERLAPSFGYTTRKASAVPWEDVPESNRSLMIAVVGEVRAALSAPAGLDHLAELLRQLDAVDEPADWNAAASALIGHVRYLVSGTGGLSHDR